MIEIDLRTAVMVYSAILGVAAAAIWVYTELSVRRPQRDLGKQFLWRCAICGLSYLDEEAENMSQCPRCASYNTPEEARQAHHESDESGAGHVRDKTGPRRSGSKGKRRVQRSRGGRR